MFLLNEMIPRTERDEMRVVRRRRYGHAASAAYVRVTELVGEHLELIRIEPVVIPEHMVV